MFEERDPIFEEENQAKLIEQIQNAPDCKIYGVSKINQRTIQGSMAVSLPLAFVFAWIVIVIYDEILTFIFLAIIGIATLVALAILSYLNHSHNYFKTYVSEFGIAKQSVWDKGAIPWVKIEFIEIKYKRDEIDYITFRVGLVTLGYRNSYFVTRLSLEIISEYIRGIENWQTVDDFGEFAETTESDRFYMKPTFDKAEGQKKLEDILLMEWIGEQDFDMNQTQEHPFSKSENELYELIVNDPQCEVIIDYGRFYRMMSSFKVIGVVFAVAISLTFSMMVAGPFSIFIAITVIALFMLMFYIMFKGHEELVMSPIGITRYFFSSPEAIEWQYIEFIDFRTEDEIPIAFEFFGNKQRVFCPARKYKQLISMDTIRKYLPNLDEWNKTKRSDWTEGTFRLVRPDE